MLSVTREYLALDGSYHPFRLHSQAALLDQAENTTPHGQALRGYHPLWHRFPAAFTPCRTTSELHSKRLQFEGARPAPRLRLELLPLRSLLLGESQLVSFPPLSYMLKLGGLSSRFEV